MSNSDVEDADKKRPIPSSGDESTKGDNIQSRLRVKKSKTTNVYSSSSEEEISDDDKKKRNKNKTKSLPKKVSKASSDDDVEEGEVSDDGNSSDELQYDDGYDDNLLGDQEDRARLASMTEREREEEIFKRLEHRQAMQRRFELEQKLRKRANQTGKGKSKLESLTKAVDDTSNRSKERRLMVEGKKDIKAKAIENLRAAREEKQQKAAEAEKKKAATGGKNSRSRKTPRDSDSDNDDEELDNVERKKVDDSGSSSGSESDDSKKATTTVQKDRSKEPIENLDELDRIRLSRFRLTRWMFAPFFVKTIQGCFVKVNFGDVSPKGETMYKLAEILGTGECAKAYSVGEPLQLTKATLRLRVFEKEREMTLAYVSNTPITEPEFEEFKAKMEVKDIPLPTREQIETKIRDINKANNYRLTDEDITNIVAAKAKLGQKPQNLVMKKAELVKMKTYAVANKDTEEAARIQQELDEINAQTLLQDAPRKMGQARMEAINRRNNSLSLKALGDAMNSVRDRTQDRVTDDPFTRRWGTPTMVHKKGAVASVSEPGVQAIKASDGNGSSVAPVTTASTSLTTTPTTASPSVRADPFNVHNFDIGIHIDLGEFPLASNPFTRRTK